MENARRQAFAAFAAVAASSDPRTRLLDLLVARAYRSSAWDRLTSALRFDGREGWEPLVNIHLERAADLERFARRIECGQISGGPLQS